MIKLENNKYFSYDMIGEFHSLGKWIHPRRTIDSFEIILVIEGMLYIAEEKQKYTLKKNQLLLLEPAKEHYGYEFISEPVSFFWLHFYTDIEIPVKILTEADVYEIKQLFKKLLHITNSSVCSPYAADSVGLLILEELKRISCEKGRSNRILSVQISEYIRNNIKDGISVSNIANHFGYNADYLGKYFKKNFGIGLKEHLYSQRLKLAKDLLLTTDMSIKQISKELGFHEENLFIKFFVYHEKITPTVFRNKYCNTHINNR